MRDWLKALAECKDVTNLRSAICELFTEFGEIAHMDILTMTHPGTRQALCFLRLESAAQEQRLMANLGVTRFGNELLFVVDLPTGQANIAEQPGDSSRDQVNRDAAVQRPGHNRNASAGDKRFWLSPARWGGTALLAARRALHQERLVR